MAAAILLTRADTAVGPTKLSVVFLGQRSAAQDSAYQKFQRELLARHRTRAERIEFSFVATPADEVVLAEALRVIGAKKPELIVAPSGHAALAARHAAPAVPLVFGTFANPVSEGVVSSMQRRPEAATGVWIANDLDAKRLEILRDAYPHIRKVAFIGDRGWSRTARAESLLPEVAARLGLQVTILYAETPEQALQLLQTKQAASFDAWCIPRTGVTVGDTRRLMDQFRALGKPLILADTAAVIAGAPMSYALDTSFAWPALADLSARILAGEHAGDIPIERPPRFVLALRTGPETGLPPPSISVVRRADLVIR